MWNVLICGQTDKNFFLHVLSQRLKFEIAEVMTEIEQLTCVGERYAIYVTFLVTNGVQNQNYTKGNS